MTITQEKTPVTEVIVGSIQVEGKTYSVYSGRTPTNYNQWWNYYKEGGRKISVLSEVWTRESNFCTSCHKLYGLNSQHYCQGRGYQ